jgi:hypothetical protein
MFSTRTLLEPYAKRALCIVGRLASLLRNPLTGSGADGRLPPIVLLAAESAASRQGYRDHGDRRARPPFRWPSDQR